MRTTRERLVGRTAEMEAVLRALDAATQGRRQVVLISGEPGIGKTRIANELADEAEQRGLHVYRARASESEGAPALWPWIQILRASIQEPAGKRALEDGGASSALLQDLLANVGRTEKAFDPSPENRFLLFDAVASFLHRFATEIPTVLIFEDVHGADETTLQMLEFVADAIPASPVLLSATFRQVEAQDRPAVDAAVAALERLGERLQLHGLLPEESIELAREVHAEFSDDIADAIADIAGGNPLFVTEVAKLARAEGSLSPELFAGPGGEGIRRAIDRRIQALPTEVRQVLAVASVIGQEVDENLLFRLVDTSEAGIRDALARATVEGLISSRADGDRFTFTHELIRQALYEGLADAARRALHVGAAELLEEAHPRHPEGLADLIAHHYSHGPVDQRRRAIAYLEEAARLAMSRFAYEGAVERSRTALALADVEDLPLRCDLLILQGQAEIRTGRGGERETLLAAARLARESKDGDRLARALITLGELKFVMASIHDDEYISELSMALEELPPDDEHLRACLLAALAKELSDPGDHEQRQAALDEALKIARSLDQPETLAEVLIADLMRTQWERSDDASAVCEDLLSAGQRLRSSPSPALKARGREVIISAWRRRSAVRLEDGDLRGFEEDVANILREVEGLPHPRLRWTCECLHATKAMIGGRFDEVEQRAESVLQTMPNELLSFAGWVVLRSAALFERKRLQEMDQVLDELVAVVPNIVGMRCYSALAKLQAGRLEDARSTMGPIFSDLRSVPEDSMWVTSMAYVGLLAHELEDDHAAKGVYEALVGHRTKHAVVLMGQPTAYFGPIELYLGMTATTAGMRDLAVEHLGRAIDEAERTGAIPWTARARAELALVLAQGDAAERRRSESLASAAATAADALSMIELKEKLPLPPHERDTVDDSHIRIQREGDVWAIRRGDRSYSVRHTRGFDHLTRLLDQPGTEMHALALIAGSSATQDRKRTDVAAEGLATGGGETALLDERAKREFRARVEELKSDIEEAETNNDTGRAAKAREELDFLVDELERVTGLGGRTRTFADPSEKARVSVTKAIRRVVDAIAKHDQGLAEYLRRTVSTGLFCSFRPDPTHEAHGDIQITR